LLNFKKVGIRRDSLEDGLMEKNENRLEVDHLYNAQSSNHTENIIIDIIIRHIKDMVFIMKVEEGSKFRYVFANDSGLKRAGITRDSIGRLIEEVLPSDKAALLQKEYESLLYSGEMTIYEDELPLENEMIVYGETILTPVKDNFGVIQYVVAVTRDITDTLKEKHRLVESEQHYRSIVDHNLDAIFSINLDGDILEANPAARLLTGYTEENLKERLIFDLILKSDLGLFKKLIEQTKAGFALESMDCRFLHQDGTTLTLHIKTVPIIIFDTIKGIYLMIRDITEQAKQAEALKYMAFHDQLTGLLNRRALMDDMEEGIKRATKSNKEMALISIDLDRFKYLNDTLGHLVGDEILKKVAERLAEIQTTGIRVYRQGGDEFMILIDHTTRQNVSRFAEKILSKFTNAFYFESQEYYITPSIGISMFPVDGFDSETLIKNADEALFRVKERGKAHYQFYRPEMNSMNHTIFSLETHLRKAIEKNELILLYQPQIDLSTIKVKSFEALIRWHSTEFGVISPGEFIPLAEETGLIIPIGDWVLETACKQIRNWNDMGHYDIRIAINISPKQFQQTSLVNRIKTMINKYKIKPSALEIEITEGAMEDKKETIPILKSLKDIGLTISVDDFGTGYSSLSYLKQFPIDVLKIDQSFVRDILKNEKDAAITSTIIHLGRSLGLEVIAEGVEEAEQVEFLLNADCQKAQGFFFARPLTSEEIEKRFL
jgi:diguanylate cyclase (GGDEF)-like protein/PAS domain S-box-containing protein